MDIVEWLRAEAKLVALDRLNEAADEIERLRAALRRVRGRLMYSCDLHDLMTDDDADAIAEADEALRSHEQSTRSK